MKDSTVFSHIAALIEEENLIREKSSVSHDDAVRLRHLNEQLDQCWDLLRQRRALREFGQSADSATPRDVEVVERYKG